MAITAFVYDESSGILCACTTEGSLAVMAPQTVARGLQPRMRNLLLQPFFCLAVAAEPLVALYKEGERALALFSKSRVYLLDYSLLKASVGSGQPLAGEEGLRGSFAFDHDLQGRSMTRSAQLLFTDGEHSLYQFNVTAEFRPQTRLLFSFKARIVAFTADVDNFYVLQRSGNLAVLSATADSIKTVDLLPQLKRLAVSAGEFDAVRLAPSQQMFTLLLFHSELVWEFNWATRESGRVIDAGCAVTYALAGAAEALFIGVPDGAICRVSGREGRVWLQGSNLAVNCALRLAEAGGEWLLSAGSAGIVDFFFNNIRVFSIAAFSA